MPNKIAAVPGVVAALPALGVATVVLCYLAIRTVTVSSSSTRRRSRSLQQNKHGWGRECSTKKKKLMCKEKRCVMENEVDCEGLVDLIRDQDFEDDDKREEEIGPAISPEELACGRLVVVVFGPASTKVYQGYVVSKLMRYLRWSNLERKHFPISEPPSLVHGGDNNDENQQGKPDYDDESVKAGVSRREAGGQHSGNDRKGHVGTTNGFGRRENGGLLHGTDQWIHTSDNGGAASSDGNGSPLRREPRERNTGALTRGYTFSDRGKAAALTTIAVQESAKAVASWLRELRGGVAVIEAGGTSWASTRHGRDALPGFLKATAGPDVGLLWVELLPAGLTQQVAHGRSGRGVGDGSGPRRSPRLGRSDSQWKSANGLPRMSQGPGERVVEEFLHSGNLLGAGGHVFYESVRGGASSGSGAGEAGGRKGAKRFCFVSLADQGSDVRSQLRHHECPLVSRVGNFAAALKMKKSWHGCPVYVTRHGESLMNQTGSMGGDTRLSENGERYALVLADFIAAQADAGQSRLAVWCSPMKRAVQTARAVKCRRYMEWQALRELDTGIFNGYSYKQMESEFPEEYAARAKDKLAYRYPQGEAYLDVVNRLHPVVVALEKEDGPILIISHQAVLRCLYAYFLDVPLRYMPRLPIPLHTVVKLTPNDDIGQDQQAARWWKEHRSQLMRPTPFEQLAVVATRKGSYAETSQLGESLS